MPCKLFPASTTQPFLCGLNTCVVHCTHGAVCMSLKARCFPRPALLELLVIPTAASLLACKLRSCCFSLNLYLVPLCPAAVMPGPGSVLGMGSSIVPGLPLWNAPTFPNMGVGPYRVAVQDGGYAALYDSRNVPIWKTQQTTTMGGL